MIPSSLPRFIYLSTSSPCFFLTSFSVLPYCFSLFPLPFLLPFPFFCFRYFTLSVPFISCFFCRLSPTLLFPAALLFFFLLLFLFSLISIALLTASSLLLFPILSSLCLFYFLFFLSSFSGFTFFLLLFIFLASFSVLISVVLLPASFLSLDSVALLSSYFPDGMCRAISNPSCHLESALTSIFSLSASCFTRYSPIPVDFFLDSPESPVNPL